MLFDIEGAQFVPHVSLANIIADDEALTKIFAAKGAAAILPCLSCKNVLAAGRDCRISNYFVTVACPDVSRFDCCTNQDFFDRMDAVNNARKYRGNRIVTKKHYESLERTMGMQSNCYGLLAATDLRCYVRAADIITHDVQHICFCGGVVGVDMHQFLLKLKEAVGMESHHI